MRVTIGYSIDAEELNETVHKLLQEARVKLYSSLEGLESACASLTTADTVEAISKIDLCRKAMYKIDNRLEDCSAILESFNQVVLQHAMAKNLEQSIKATEEEEIDNQTD